MKCNVCREFNDKNAKFCQKCGALMSDKKDSSLESKSPLVKEVTKKSFKSISKKVIGIIVVCLILIIGGSYAFNTLKPGKYEFQKANISFITIEGEKSAVIVDTNVLDTKIDGEVSTSQTNFDGTKAIALSSNKTLYYVTTSEVLKIAEDVRHCIFSALGDGVAYIDAGYNLQLYTYSDKQSLLVAKNITKFYIAISPDAKAVTYVDPRNELFVYKGGQSTLVGKDLKSVAVSNSGKYVYSYSRDNNSLYVSSIGKEKSKIAGDISGDTYLLNRDHSEIIFYSDDSSYISINGKEKQKLSSDYILPLVPQKTSILGENLSDVYTRSYPQSSLLDNIFVEDNYALITFNNKFESNKVMSVYDATENSQLDKKGDTIFFIAASILYKKPIDSSEESILIANDVDRFVISSDGNYVYYINDDDELWCKKGNSDSRKISDDVDNFIITDKDVLLFLTDYKNNSGMLYSCSNGKEKNKISDDAYYIQATTTAAYYFSNHSSPAMTYDIYASFGNAKFSLIVENAR